MFVYLNSGVVQVEKIGVVRVGGFRLARETGLVSDSSVSRAMD